MKDEVTSIFSNTIERGRPADAGEQLQPLVYDELRRLYNAMAGPDIGEK